MMNKTLLAVAVGLLLAPSVGAVELYKSKVTQVDLGGYMTDGVLDSGGSTEVADFGSRINFSFNNELRNGTSLFSKLEWGISPFQNQIVFNKNTQWSAQSDNLLNSRLAYIGLSHDDWGSFSVGKQWGYWYNVVSGTDNANIWGGAAGGEYNIDGAGSLDGTGRADRSLQYNNTLGGLSLSLQAQIQDNTIDITDPDTPNPDDGAFNEFVRNTLTFGNTYGGSLSYAITSMLSVAVGGNWGSFDGFVNKSGLAVDIDDTIYGGSITWGNFSGDGLYVSANYNWNEYHNTDVDGYLIPEASGVEVFISYLFDTGYQPYFVYNGLSARGEYKFPSGNGSLETVTDSNQQYYVLGLSYYFDAVMEVFIEGQINGSDYAINGVPQDNSNGIGAGLIYNF